MLLGIDLVKDRESREPAVEDASNVVKRALYHGLIVRTSGRYSNVLQLCPPLTISGEQVSQAVEILKKVIE